MKKLFLLLTLLIGTLLAQTTVHTPTLEKNNTWTGTNIFNNPVQGPDGTAGAPSFSFSTATNSGFYHAGGGIWSFSRAGVSSLLFSSGGVIVTPSSGAFEWTAGSTSNAPDTTVNRNGVGGVGIGTGANSTSGYLALGGTPVAVAGTIRMPQGASLAVRNSTNTGDQVMAASNGANGFTFGANQEIATGGVVTITANGASRFLIPRNDGVFNTLVARSDGVYAFSSTTGLAAPDTGISRSAANVVAVGTSAQGDVSGTIVLAEVALGGTTATFPGIFRNPTTGTEVSFGKATGPTTPTGIAFGVSSQNSDGLFVGNTGIKMGQNSFIAAGSGGVSSFASFTPDAGISRLGVASWGIGNGTAGDLSGTAKAAIFDAGTGLRIGGLAATNHILLGNGTNYVDSTINLTSSQVANQGTTTTVLHGNAAGNPAFGSVTSSDIDSTVASASGTQTLSSKRITQRVVTVTNATTLTPDGDNSDVSFQNNTQAAGTLTVAAPSGTPTDGQKLIIRAKTTNAQTYSFNATYRFSTTTAAPTTLAAGKTDYIGCIWNATDSKWDVVAVDQGR